MGAFGMLMLAAYLASPHWLHASPKPVDVDESLRAWLEQLSADEPYLLVDGTAQTVSLMHAGAVLRVCALRGEQPIALPAARDTLEAHLRRYRPLVPLAQLQPGSFDWEDRLVREAPDDGALYFASGALLAADDVWQRQQGTVLLVDVRDFRALYNAGVDGMPLVFLPVGWQLDE